MKTKNKERLKNQGKLGENTARQDLKILGVDEKMTMD